MDDKIIIQYPFLLVKFTSDRQNTVNIVYFVQ